jgi:MazG family protein
MSAESAPDSSRRGVARLREVVARLRGEGGCPWDREQTLASLKPHLIEECYELVEAVDSGDAERHIEELGDVLLQVALHAQIRSEEGRFNLDDVAERLAEKLVRRHPHVFGNAVVSGSEQVLRNWEAIKAGEKQGEDRSPFDGLPRHLPSLQKAQRVQSRAARVGFDWSRIEDVFDKVREELDEAADAVARGGPERVGEEVGDLLFAAVNLARFAGVDAEDALRRTTDKFIRRFREIERRARGQGRALKDCSPAEMDALWEAVKAEGG